MVVCGYSFLLFHLAMTHHLPGLWFSMLIESLSLNSYLSCSAVGRMLIKRISSLCDLFKCKFALLIWALLNHLESHASLSLVRQLWWVLRMGMGGGWEGGVERCCLIVTVPLLRGMWSLGRWSLQHVGLEHSYMDMKMSHMRVVYWSVVPAVLLARFLGEAFGEALPWRRGGEREGESKAVFIHESMWWHISSSYQA